MNPWITIALSVEPLVVDLVKAILALRKKYPALTAAEINAALTQITGQAETAFDDVLAKIAADQAAHPGA